MTKATPSTSADPAFPAGAELSSSIGQPPPSDRLPSQASPTRLSKSSKLDAILATMLSGFVLFFSIATACTYRTHRFLLDDGRIAADIPKFDWKNPTKFTNGCEAALSDQFFLKDSFLHPRAEFLYHRLNCSANPNVYVGKNGWLFYGGYDYIAEFCGLKPLTEDELKSLQRMFEARALWLKQRNCKFVIMPTLAKETVCLDAERVPTHNAGKRLRQLVEWMRQKSFVEVIDLRDDLRNAGRARQIYAKYDLHWNAQGAFIAYRALMSRLAAWFPDLYPLKENELAVNRDPSRVQYDLGRMMHLPRPKDAEPLHDLTPKSPAYSMGQDAPWIVTSTIPGSSLPKAVVLKDSFFEFIQPLFAQHFSEAKYISSFDLPIETIEQFKPDVVVQEFNEFYLSRDNIFGLDLDRLQADELARRVKELFEAVPNSQNIIFGPVVQLDRAEMVRMPSRTLLRTLWTVGKHPEQGRLIGIHVLDKDGNILQQFDHTLIPALHADQKHLTDCVSIPEGCLADAVAIGLSIYADPQHVHAIHGGRCDLENHRLLLPLPNLVSKDRLCPITY